MKTFVAASLALAVASLPIAARADTAAELTALRQEIAALRAAYEARLQALEQRLQQRGAEPTAATAAAVPAPAPPPVPPSAEPVASATTAAANPPGGNAAAFNPALSLILSGRYARLSRDPAQYSIAGFPRPLDAEFGPGPRGFSLAETELTFAASIDPWLRGAATIAVHPDNAVSIEEAFIQTTALGNGLALKAGRFFSGVGYLNSQHAHTWDFIDNPLAYQALLGTQYGDDGVQLTWLAPLDQYLEFGAELGRGRGFPGSDTGRNGAGMGALFAHTGGDIGASQSWRAGLSVLSAKASDQRLAGSSNDSVDAFSGNTRVWIADALWKWAPNGNATRTNLKLQGEYLRSTRSGSLMRDIADASATAAAYRAVQSGWYVQGVYQFMPRWRVGLRTERLRGADAQPPQKNALLFEFSPSEFSRFSLQLANDRSRAGPADRQLLLQYQTSLGAHGAHGY